jgi:hypothetical protein
MDMEEYLSDLDCLFTGRFFPERVTVFLCDAYEVVQQPVPDVCSHGVAVVGVGVGHELERG